MKQGLAITRNRVLVRAKYGWPRRTVPFNVRGFHTPSGYTTSAAGYVSMCYDIPISMRHWGGANVITLLSDGFMKEIKPDELLPGDAIGYLGSDAMDGDGGVIVIFDRWLNNDPVTRMALTWAHLPTMQLGPDLRGIPVNYKWKAYRYVHILDQDPDPVSQTASTSTG